MLLGHQSGWLSTAGTVPLQRYLRRNREEIEHWPCERLARASGATHCYRAHILCTFSEHVDRLRGLDRTVCGPGAVVL
jgi:hypothetical protein